jgi:hypothetical protein
MSKRVVDNLNGAVRLKWCCNAKSVLVRYSRLRFRNEFGRVLTRDSLGGAESMSTDNEWWTWIVIGTIFLLTTPATYIPVAMVLGFF